MPPQGLTTETFDGYLGRKEYETRNLKYYGRKVKKYFMSQSLIDFFLNRFPIIRLLGRYKPRELLIRDIISGISVGMAVIPQSMGYATIMNIPVMYGLFSTVFASIIFSIFTTSTYNSCTISVSGALFIRDSLSDLNLLDDNPDDPTLVDRRLQAVLAMGFIGGIVFILITLTRLNVYVRFCSEPHMGAAITAISIIVLIQQTAPMLGIQTQSHSGAFQIFKFLEDVFTNIDKTNIATMVISLVCLAILLFVKMFVNARYGDKLPFPIPIDMMLIIVASGMSKALEWNEKYDVKIVGTIPSDIPKPSLPLDSEWTTYLSHGITFGILSYTAIFVLFQNLAAKHNDPINLSQEGYAMGLSFVLGSFVATVAPGIALSRIFIMESSGGKTQLSYVFAAITSLVIILTLADFGSDLPSCVIAAIMFVTFMSGMDSFKRLRKYWRKDKVYLMMYGFTFTITMLFSFSDGVVYGLLFCMAVTLVRTAYPKCKELQFVQYNDGRCWVDSKAYHTTRSLPNVTVIGVSGFLYFANTASVKNYVVDLVKAKKLSSPPQNDSVTKLTTIQKADTSKTDESEKPKDPGFQHLVILDLSCVSHLDTSGLRMLQALKGVLKSLHATDLAVCCVPEAIKDTLLQNAKVMDKLQHKVYVDIEQTLAAEWRTGDSSVTGSVNGINGAVYDVEKAVVIDNTNTADTITVL